MDDVLKLIDALRTRGAIEITTKDVSVKFATPMVQTALNFEDTSEPVMEKTPTLDEVERLMYMETSKL
jgi:hypothetical protein